MSLFKIKKLNYLFRAMSRIISLLVINLVLRPTIKGVFGEKHEKNFCNYGVERIFEINSAFADDVKIGILAL